jgi:hypothetical protein
MARQPLFSFSVPQDLFLLTPLSLTRLQKAIEKDARNASTKDDVGPSGAPKIALPSSRNRAYWTTTESLLGDHHLVYLVLRRRRRHHHKLLVCCNGNAATFSRPESSSPSPPPLMMFPWGLTRPKLDACHRPGHDGPLSPPPLHPQRAIGDGYIIARFDYYDQLTGTALCRTDPLRRPTRTRSFANHCCRTSS